MKIIVVFALAAAGCAHLSPGAAAIQQVNEDQVVACHFLVRVDAGHVPRSAASDLEVESQKKDALEEAAARGATHVVWNERRMPDRIRISAGAYRCPPTARASSAPAAASAPSAPAAASAPTTEPAAAK